MAFYLVTADVKGSLDELKRRLDAGEVRKMRPFGSSLDHSLREARVLGDGVLTWEEEDYCSRPSPRSGRRSSITTSRTSR